MDKLWSLPVFWWNAGGMYCGYMFGWSTCGAIGCSTTFLASDLLQTWHQTKGTTMHANKTRTKMTPMSISKVHTAMVDWKLSYFLKNSWVIENFYRCAYFTCFHFLDRINFLYVVLCWRKPDQTISTVGEGLAITNDSLVSQAPKVWIWFDQYVFTFINVPDSSIQNHLDSFLLFEVLKPIANLNFLFLFFSELIKIKIYF